jgi:hypothetical protein
MTRVFKECVICKGQKKRPRNGTGGKTCSASECKAAYKEQRTQPTVGLALGADATSAEKMPIGMWVQSIEEILGERCCELLKMSHKKRKNGPGASKVQEFLVRGYFLEDDGDDGDEEVDQMPEPNTFWIEKPDLLETIDIEDVKDALRERHEAVLEGL